MPKRAQLADGTTLEFPDDTPDAVMDRVVKQHVVPATRQEKVAAGEPRKEKEESWSDFASKRGRDVIEGLGGLVGSIADVPGILRGEGLTNAVTSAVGKATGKPTVPIYQPSQDINPIASKAADKLKLQRPSQEKTFEGAKQRLWSDVTKGAAAAAVPVAGTEGLIGQIAGGITGGLASGGAREAGAPEWAQTLFGLAGGLVPAGVTAGFNVAGAAKDATLRPQRRADIRLQRSAQNLPKAIENLENRPAPSPGTQPTMAEAAGDIGLSSTQRAHGYKPNDIIEQQARNAQARAGTTEQILGPGDPKAVQDLAQREVADRAQAVKDAERIAERNVQGAEARGEGALSRVQARVAGVADRVAQRAKRLVEKRTEGVNKVYVSPEESAQAVRPEFEGQYADAKARTQKEYNHRALTNPHAIKMGADDVELLHDDLLNKTGKYYGSGTKGPTAEAKATVQDLFKELEDKTINSETLLNIDSRLADHAGSLRVAGRAKEAAFAESLRDTIKANTDAFMSPRVKAQIAKAKAARLEQGRVFEQGKVGPMFNPKAIGEVRVPDTELAGKLVKPGDIGATHADQLIASVGRPAASKLVSEHMRRLIEDEKLTDSQIRNFKPLLDKFNKPGEAGETVRALQAQRATNAITAGKVDTIGKRALKAQEKANQADIQRAKAAGDVNIAAKEQAGREFGQTPLGQAAPELQGTVEHISGLLADTRGSAPMKAFYEQIKNDPAAVAGARRSLAEHINTLATKGAEVDAAGQPVPHARKTMDAIDNILDRSGGLLDDSQRTALAHIRKELEGVEVARTGKQPVAGREDASIPFVKHGVTARSIRWVMAHVTNENQVNKIIHDAILDPELAKDMLKRPTPNRLARLKRSLRTGVTGGFVASQAQQ